MATNGEVDMLKKALVPNGIYKLGVGENFSEFGNGLPQSEFELHKQAIKNNMDEILGRIDTLANGARGIGVYSGAMLERIQNSAEMKPNQMENRLLNKCNEIAQKVLYMIKRYIGESGINMFNPFTQENVILTVSDIDDSRYLLEIDTQDANLLTNETKFKIIEKFMQYGQSNPLLVYQMAMMTNNAIPHLFPEAIIKSFKFTADKYIQAMEQSQQQEEEIPIEEQDIDADTFENEILNLQNEMMEMGIPEEQIMEVRKSIVDDNVGSMPKADILLAFKQYVEEQRNQYKGE
jgi:hypothetical protein